MAGELLEVRHSCASICGYSRFINPVILEFWQVLMIRLYSRRELGKLCNASWGEASHFKGTATVSRQPGSNTLKKTVCIFWEGVNLLKYSRSERDGRELPFSPNTLRPEGNAQSTCLCSSKYTLLF